MARNVMQLFHDRTSSGVPFPSCIEGGEDHEPRDEQPEVRHQLNPFRRIDGEIIGEVAARSSRLEAVH